MMAPAETHAVTTRAIKHAKASEQYARALINASMAGFSLDLLPRRTDDLRTLIIPRSHPLPKTLLEQLMELAAYLRGRATDGVCSPVKLYVQHKPQQAPN